MEGFYGGYNEYGGGSSGYGGGGSQNNSTSDGPGPIPNRWLHCPRTAQDFIANRFLAFKTPLSARFASQMGNEFHFTPDMVFSYMKMEKVIHIKFVLSALSSVSKKLNQKPFAMHTVAFTRLNH